MIRKLAAAAVPTRDAAMAIKAAPTSRRRWRSIVFKLREHARQGCGRSAG